MVTNTGAARVMRIPRGLTAAGVRGRPFVPAARIEQLPPGQLLRVTFGELDLLLAHTDRGVCATDDRCPHMAAPLSLGTLDGCVVGCPLHSGRFDLADGSVVQFPTTGGLDAQGGYHPPWSPPGTTPKAPPTDLKARARAATRIRRVRYYPLRIQAGRIEVRLPRLDLLAG